MKVILLSDVKNVGKKNEVVDVSDGYAKNFLFKGKLAQQFTTGNNKQLNSRLAELDAQEQENIKKAQEVKQQIENIRLEFELASNNGVAFGTISNKQVIEELKKKGINIDKFMIKDSNNYGLGTSRINIDLYKGKVLAILVIIVKSKNN